MENGEKRHKYYEFESIYRTYGKQYSFKYIENGGKKMRFFFFSVRLNIKIGALVVVHTNFI